MAIKDVNALDELDLSFSSQLKCRNRSVLQEIASAYRSDLQRLLRRSLGALLSEEDVEEILEIALAELWSSYSPDHDTSVRFFYFEIGKRRLIDRLRRNQRHQKAIKAAIAGSASCPQVDNSDPSALLTRVESAETHRNILELVAKAVKTQLSERQRVAFQRRFQTGNSKRWAKALEIETGVPAKKWRKASDEARKKVAQFLQNHGVQYSVEGGHYEIAKSRSTA